MGVYRLEDLDENLRMAAHCLGQFPVAVLDELECEERIRAIRRLCSAFCLGCGERKMRCRCEETEEAT